MRLPVTRDLMPGLRDPLDQMRPPTGGHPKDEDSRSHLFIGQQPEQAIGLAGEAIASDGTEHTASTSMGQLRPALEVNGQTMGH